MRSVVVIDFETTGLSTRGGDRVIEVGAVAIEDGQVTDCFQSLINPGFAVNSFIENYTHISNSMLSTAPAADAVFPQLHRFIGNSVMVAHNASFDQKFLDAELARVGYLRTQPFVCSMRVARRLYPRAPNHKLGTLVRHARIPVTGDFHRALDDARMTALLWLEMMRLLERNYGISEAELGLLQKLECMSIGRAHDWLGESGR